MRELELIDALEKVFTFDDPRVVRWLGDDVRVVRARLRRDLGGYRRRRPLAAASHRRARSATTRWRRRCRTRRDGADPAAYPRSGAEWALSSRGPELAAGAQALAADCAVTIAGGDVTWPRANRPVHRRGLG
jgi:hypothetical protein